MQHCCPVSTYLPSTHIFWLLNQIISRAFKQTTQKLFEIMSINISYLVIAIVFFKNTLLHARSKITGRLNTSFRQTRVFALVNF